MAKRIANIILVSVLLIAAAVMGGCSLVENISQVAQAAEILPFTSGETESGAESSVEADATVNMRATETDIGKIIKEVYSEDVCRGICIANDDTLRDVFLIDPENVLEYRILYTDGIYGVQDICIIKPAVGCKDVVLEQLRQWKDSRMAFFEHYDVNGAYAIMQNAMIYTQGEYIIYLAVDDMEAAMASVDNYIPY